MTGHKWVIVNPDNGYVKDDDSYTKYLSKACIFNTREEARLDITMPKERVQKIELKDITND